MKIAFLSSGQTSPNSAAVVNTGSDSSTVATGAQARRRPVRGVPGNDRLKAFSDGVFAITTTLLVLEIGTPHPPTELSEALVHQVFPEAVATVASFVLLGVYWVGHHNMFMHIKRHDRTLLWLNILFL